MRVYIYIHKKEVRDIMKKLSVMTTLLAVLALAACSDTEDEDTSPGETGVDESETEEETLDDDNDDTDDDNEVENDDDSDGDDSDDDNDDDSDDTNDDSDDDED